MSFFLSFPGVISHEDRIFPNGRRRVALGRKGDAPSDIGFFVPLCGIGMSVIDGAVIVRASPSGPIGTMNSGRDEKIAGDQYRGQE